MNTISVPSVFFEMIRSFVALGSTCNLTHAVNALGVSRQTIRRHIRELERIKGVKLLDTRGRQYQLTDAGRRAIVECEKLIHISQNWLDGKLATPFELSNIEIDLDDSSWMYGQQHPLSKIWDMAPPILLRGLEGWTASHGRLDLDAFKKIQPYTVVSRKYRGEWLMVEVGEMSAYATWLGLSAARSELGRRLDLGEKYAPMVRYWRRAYDAVLGSGCLWYEHISTCMPRHRDKDAEPANYQRLVMPFSFADQEPAVVVIAARTNSIEIPGLPARRKQQTAPADLMEFEI